MIGYKVVRTLSKGVWGPVMADADQSFRYQMGKITSHDNRKNGPMALFNSSERAICFAQNLHHLRPVVVVKCEFLPSSEKKLWCQGGLWTHQLRFCPPGTVLAESLTPLEQVYPEKEIQEEFTTA